MIDAVLVINLEHRIDRWTEVSKHLQQHLPEEPAHRLKAIYGKELPGFGSPRWFRRSRRPATWAGKAGCSASHRDALRMIAENHWQWTLIFEDDIQIVSPLAPLLSGPLTDFINNHGSQFQFYYLGWNAPNLPVRQLAPLDENHAIYQIDGALTTHAYLIHYDLATALLRELPQEDADWWQWIAKHRVIDKWYCDTLKKRTSVAAISPPLVIQSDSLSDITLRQGGCEPTHGSSDLLKDLALKTQAEPPLSTVARGLKRRYSIAVDALKSIQLHLVGFS